MGLCCSVVCKISLTLELEIAWILGESGKFPSFIFPNHPCENNTKTEKNKGFYRIKCLVWHNWTSIEWQKQRGECLRSSFSLLCFWQPGTSRLTFSTVRRRLWDTGTRFKFAPVGSMRDLNKWSQIPLWYYDRVNTETSSPSHKFPCFHPFVSGFYNHPVILHWFLLKLSLLSPALCRV